MLDAHPSNTYRSVRIQVASHIFNFKLQLLLRSILGTLNPTFSSRTLAETYNARLECQMLQEVSRAIGLVCLCPRSRVDPDTNS